LYAALDEAGIDVDASSHRYVNKKPDVYRTNGA
jgi:hypothetical protein